ncbi:MAG: prephenate dehydrogenase/arogenate dehydrogenase family protein [Myxococcota bacterium]
MTATKVLIVGGAGRMGRRLREVLEDRGHRVDVLDRGDAREPAEVVRAADVTILAVPMSAAVEATRALAPHVRPDALFCDINSLKVEVCRAAEEVCPGEVLGLHPMFGPSVRSFAGQKVVVCRIRSGPRTDWLLGELRALDMALHPSDPETHDRMMAVVQVLVHFRTLVMGEALRRIGVPIEDSLAFTSPAYRLELAVVGRLFAQDPDLYAEIEMQNPFGAEVRRAFVEAAGDLRDIADGGDRAGFHDLFVGVGEHLGAFVDEAYRLSDEVIEAVIAADRDDA